MEADSKLFVFAVGLVGACSCSAPPREPITGVPATSAPIESHDTDSDGHGAMAPSVRGEGTGGVPVAPWRAEETPEKEVVLGSDGQPIGVAERVRYTTGPGSCPPSDGETRAIGKNERCPCRCGPLKPPAALESCEVRYVSVNASSLSPTDGCTGGVELRWAPAVARVRRRERWHQHQLVPVLARSLRSAHRWPLSRRGPRCVLRGRRRVHRRVSGERGERCFRACKGTPTERPSRAG